MRKGPDVSKNYGSLYGCMHECFISERYHQGQFSEREDTCLWLMQTNFMINRKSLAS